MESHFYPDGAGIKTSNGTIILSTDYYLLAIFFCTFIIVITLYAYIRLEPVCLTKITILSRKLWIFVYSTFIVWGIFMLPWAPKYSLEIGSGFLIGGLIVVVYMAIGIPESMLISQIQVRRAIKLYNKVQLLVTDKAIEEFGMKSLVEYLKNIPREMIE